MEVFKLDAENVVARALSLPEVVSEEVLAEVEEVLLEPGEVNGMKDREARPSRLVSSEALGLVCSDVSADIDGSFLLFKLAGDAPPAVDALLLLPAVELLLFCTRESGCLRGEW